MRMSVVTGAKALIVGAVAEGAAQSQSLTLTVVAGAFVLGAAIVVPITNYLLSRLRKPAIDHRSELIGEQAEFIEHLRAELVEARADAADKNAELARLRRRRA